MKPNRADFPDGPAGEAAYADALRHHREEDTPVLRPRSVSSVLTSWGIISTWLATDSKRRVEMLVGPQGLAVHVIATSEVWTIELVRPNEDPSAAAVRAIGNLRSV